MRFETSHGWNGVAMYSRIERVLLSALFMLPVVGAMACIPEKSCEFTKTCVEPTTDASQSAAPATSEKDASVAVGANASSTSDAASSSDEDAGLPLITCTRSTQCPAQQPFCDEASGVCTGCRSNTDCSVVGAPFCLLDSSPQLNRCVECLEDQASDTCSGACVDYHCVACDPANNQGCSGTKPVCVERDDGPVCVECASNTDCTDSDAPYCSADQCKACSAADPESCPPERPVCVEENDAARCVECVTGSDCSSRSDADPSELLCVQEHCTACVLGSDEGCPIAVPFCAAVVTNEEDAGVSYLAPSGSEEPAANQYLEYQHVCVECVNDGGCGGSLPGCFQGQCVECTENAHCKDASASVCDLSSHTCVGCQAVGDCSHQRESSACDTVNRVCVECTAAEDSCADKACRTIPGEGQYTCSAATKGQTSPCFPCVSDSACLPGAKCVQESYEGAGEEWRCFWREAELDEENECGDLRVFGDNFSATSVDGSPGPYCALRLTSCDGYRDFGTGPVISGSGQPTCLSHDDCGVPGVDDGFCIPATSNNRCTYRCLSDEDCDEPLKCATQTGVDNQDAKVCLLNP